MYVTTGHNKQNDVNNLMAVLVAAARSCQSAPRGADVITDTSVIRTFLTSDPMCPDTKY